MTWLCVCVCVYKLTDRAQPQPGSQPIVQLNAWIMTKIRSVFSAQTDDFVFIAH